MDTTAHEIQQVEQQLAEADRTTQARDDLAAKLARLKDAEAKAAEARRLERDAADAARDVQLATAAELRERVAPLVAAADALGPRFAALEADVQASLHRAVADARVLHGRYRALVAQHNALRAECVQLGARDALPVERAVGFEAFVRQHLRALDTVGASWKGEED